MKTHIKLICPDGGHFHNEDCYAEVCEHGIAITDFCQECESEDMKRGLIG